MPLYENEETLTNEKQVALTLASTWGLLDCRKIHNREAGVDYIADVNNSRYPHLAFEIKCRSKRFGSFLIDVAKLRKIKAYEEKHNVRSILVVRWEDVINWCRPSEWVWHNALPANFRVGLFSRQEMRDINDHKDLVAWIPYHLLYPLSKTPMQD